MAARRVAAYCRVSTAEQVENGHSLDAQRNRLIAYATGTERVVDAFYVDAGYSAGTIKRPELQRLLSDIRNGQISVVMVTKLDRLSRSLRDLLEIVELCKKKDIALVSASESLDTSTAMGRAMLQLLGTFAELELARIGERTSEVLFDRRRQGKVYGRTPFGYRRDGDRLVEDAKQQRALAEARRMHAAGASYRQIGARLTELGVKPNNGAKCWHAASVRAMLLSRMNAAAA